MLPDAATDGHRAPATLDTSVVARLRAVAGRLRRYVLIEGLAWVVGFLVASACLQLAVDYGSRGLRWSMRAAMLAAIIGGAAYLVWRRIVSPLRQRFGAAEVANLVERRYPHLASHLISAVRFSKGEVGPSEINSPALAASVVRRAQRAVAGVDFNQVLDPRRAKRSGAALIAALLFCVLATAGSPDTVARWFARNVLLQNVEWPKRTHLIVEVEGDELIGARGDDLVVQAHADGVEPREVEIIFETASGQRGRETMVTVGSEGSYHYRYTFKGAQEDFVFRLRGGDDLTRDYRARLLERPRVAWTEMRITPPAYTGLEAFTLADGERTAEVLPGSEVTLLMKPNHAVTSATLMAGRETVADAVMDGDRFAAHFSPTETHTYHFALMDEVGLENRRPVRFSLRVVRDEAPRVRLKLPGVGDMITVAAILPMELEFADTYGLAAAELVYRVSREAATDVLVPLPAFRSGMSTFSTSLAWPISAKDVVAGDTLTLFVRATDLNTVTGPGSAQSPEITLRVVTREELLAELARREQEYRMDFERLVDSQERIRGGLLSVLARSQEGADAEVLGVELAPLERRQRTLTGSVNVVRQRFAQILSELAVNQLDTRDERKRLGGGVIEPLTQLATRDLVTAADTIRQWSRAGSPEKGSLIDPQQVAVLSQMRAVLANMLQWEGYQEVVTMLRDIIRLQRELHTETKQSIEDQAGDVFDK